MSEFPETTPLDEQFQPYTPETIANLHARREIVVGGVVGEGSVAKHFVPMLPDCRPLPLAVVSGEGAPVAMSVKGMVHIGLGVQGRRPNLRDLSLLQGGETQQVALLSVEGKDEIFMQPVMPEDSAAGRVVVDNPMPLSGRPGHEVDVSGNKLEAVFSVVSGQQYSPPIPSRAQLLVRKTTHTNPSGPPFIIAVMGAPLQSSV